MARFFTVALLIGLTHGLATSQGYKIKINTESLKDTTVLLGYFYGESTYVKDTAQTNSKGDFVFEGAEPLDQGVYFVVHNKSRLFDFPVGKDQTFTLTTHEPDHVLNMQVEGDIDNEIYFKDLKYNSQRNEEAQPYLAVLNDSTASATEKAGAREALQALNEQVMAHQQEIIDEYPEAIISKIHKANKRVKIPDVPAGEDAQTFSYNYYKSHYWDYFDLADPVLLKLANPVYKEKLNNYLDKMVMQQPDSLINEIDNIVARAKTNQDTYKYAVWSAVIKYQYPEIMGLDEVYVHLYDKYFASGEMDFWANEQLKNNLKERADQLRNSLIGKTAPNLIMLDKDLQRKSLYDIPNEFTVIYFFDPDCGHCKKETPKLVEFYNDTQFDVEVFAVSADTSMVKMNKYIEEMEMPWITVNGPRTATQPYQKLYDATTTPTIYVLDKNKKIIAKKLPAERLNEFLTRYDAIEQRNKP